MDLSVFLAKLLGLYTLIVSLLWLIRKDELEASSKEFVSSKGLILFAGAFSLIVGLAIVIGHPVWELNWRGLITLLGYLSIVKGVMRIGFPEFEQFSAAVILRRGYWVTFLVLLVLGGYLTYSGFTA